MIAVRAEMRRCFGDELIMLSKTAKADMNGHIPGGINDCCEGRDEKREALGVNDKSNQSARLRNLLVMTMILRMKVAKMRIKLKMTRIKKIMINIFLQPSNGLNSQ